MTRLDDLLPEVYEELQRLAARAMRSERASHTLDPTALVHETYLRLAQTPSYAWASRHQLLGAAARAMRQVLVDYARQRNRGKRGGGALRVTLSPEIEAVTPDVDALVLHEALDRLEALDAQQVRIVELRFLAGMSVEEVAELLEVSPRTVKRDSMMARAWLVKELGADVART
jgi:RNA polymerase sigma factor (TIGR02999 family)